MMQTNLTNLAMPLAARFNPFPGLRPFEPDEDYLFFGREKQTDELVHRLRTTRFLSILGTSGCGKSSLVRSGLIPSLYGGGMTRAGSSWRVAILRPGEDPLGNLAAALSAPEALGAGDDPADPGLTRAFFETTLRASKMGLVECIRQVRLRERDNVLVLIDQFEEIFRFKRSRRVAGHDEAIAFVKLLLEAAQHREVPCYIALTMRSDFIGNCMEFGDLPEAINAGLYLVPRMTRDELRSAVAGPVAVGGSMIAPRLVSRLLNDVGDDPDQLPILQHALLRTWDCWEDDHTPGEPLDLRHYEAIGTMGEALSRHAEEAFGELDAAGRALAEKLFKALTDKGTDDRGIRHPAPLEEICDLTGASASQVAAVVETFRKPGRSFLMPPPGIPLHTGSILDISHESLMRVWERMAGWVDEEARSARLYLGVAEAAARHEEGVAALWRDPELQLALTWREAEHPTEAWARRYDPAFLRAMSFLDASKAERDQQIAEQDARRRRELRRARILALVFAAVSLVILAFGAYAWRQKQTAQEALTQAREQKKVADEQKELADTQKGIATRQAEEAGRQKERAQQQSLLAEEEKQNAQRQEQNAEQQSKLAQEQRGIAEGERQKAEARTLESVAARSAEQKQRQKAEEEQQQAETARGQAQASEQQALRLRRISLARALSLQIVRPQQGGEARELPALLALEAYRLNRDNGGVAEDPDLFNALRVALGPLPALRGHQDGVRAVALVPDGPPDGQTVFSGGEDGKLLRFDLRQPAAPPVLLASFPTPVRAVAVRPEGDLLAAAAADIAEGPIRLWNLRQPGALPRDLPATAAVSSLAFQPGGGLLAAGSPDGVKLWDTGHPAGQSNTAPLSLGAGKRVTAVAFSPDGKTLAAGLAKGGALLWEVGRPSAEPRSACGALDVRSLAFSPDGKTLACGAGRGEIALAAVGRAGAALVSLPGHAASVNSLRFNAQGDFLASASSDGTVRLWDVKSPGSQPIVLPGHEGWVWSVAFTPDGQRLVSGGQDRTVRLWPARTETLARALCAGVHRGLTKEEWKRSMPADLAYVAESPCPIPSRGN
jgi:WD40 repeat protein/energy-coupling factor transporter ATP-binding protein EcfA2